jgi:hypothetical protein
MEISQQNSDFKTRFLKVYQFVDRDKMAEMDLTTGFIPCINFFLRLGEKVTLSYVSIKNNGL